MNKISAKVIADSKGPLGDRITTMVVTFPRIVLSEFNTHRMFSRNSASSRAIPFNRMVKMVKEYPFFPIAWQKEHTGMQGTEYLIDKDEIDSAWVSWKDASEDAIYKATELNRTGVTKQLANRLLEPYMWHTAIVTSTEWENFFKLRCPQYGMHYSYGKHYFRSRKSFLKEVGFPDERSNYDSWTDLDWLQLNKGGAEIHISLLAEAMYDALNESTPKNLAAGEWHIPFGDQIDVEKLMNMFYGKEPKETWYAPLGNIHYKIKVATARCARVSYINYEGKDDYEADIRLFDTLTKNGHASPLEHCARAMSPDEYSLFVRGMAEYFVDETGMVYMSGDGEGWCRNFRGFIQLRHLVETQDSLSL